MQLPVTWFARSVLHFAASLAFAFGVMAQSSSESLSLLTTDNAYNPIPSPDGRYVAYVRTGWGESLVSSMGRSSLVSDVKIMSVEGAATPRTLAKEYFLSGWTPDSTQLVCYRDWKYALVSTDGERIMEGRIPNDPNKHPAPEWAAYSPSLATIVWSRLIDNSHGAIETLSRTVVKKDVLRQERVVPSPDGRYLALFGEFPEADLRVYDLRLKSWTDLGRISVHPDKDWSYVQPNWNPWFADARGWSFLGILCSLLPLLTARRKRRLRLMVQQACQCRHQTGNPLPMLPSSRDPCRCVPIYNFGEERRSSWFPSPLGPGLAQLPSRIPMKSTI
jgi:WD40-like Beta Propeller Repeat